MKVFKALLCFSIFVFFALHGSTAGSTARRFCNDMRLYAKKGAAKIPLSWEEAGKDGTTLVIVESPAKAKTIQKFLDEAGVEDAGGKYVIDFCAGHIRELLSSKNRPPEMDFLKKKVIYDGLNLRVSDIGVDVFSEFKPIYVPMPDKKDVITRLQKATKTASRVLLATDEGIIYLIWYHIHYITGVVLYIVFYSK